MAINNEIVDELLKDVDPKKVFSSEGLLAEIKKALAERMLNAEMDQHLEGEAAACNGESSGNHRNGYSKKTVITDTSQMGSTLFAARTGAGALIVTRAARNGGRFQVGSATIAL
jgi:putative transposase